MNWFSASYRIIWVSAPRFVWLAAAIIVVSTFWQLWRLVRAVFHEESLNRNLIDSLNRLHEEHPIRRDGLSGAGYEALHALGRTLENRFQLHSAWRNYEEELIRRTDFNDGHDSYSAERSAMAIFPEAAVLSERIN
jgi:hypothetical protein